MSVLSYTLDVSDGSLAHGGDADGGTAAMAGLVWRHAAYHGCALGAGYTLLLQRRFAAPLLRADPRLRALVDAGALEMVLKPVMPALSVGRTLKWQALCVGRAVGGGHTHPCPPARPLPSLTARTTSVQVRQPGAARSMGACCASFRTLKAPLFVSAPSSLGVGCVRINHSRLLGG